MTVCKKIAGPILAGGIALLPPASGVPGAGGVGGFPVGAPSEYGAPGFYGPGPYASAFGPGGYGGFPGGGAFGPGSAGGVAPVLFATNEPVVADSTPPVPIIPIVTEPGQPIQRTPPGDDRPPANPQPPDNSPPPDKTPPETNNPPGESTPGTPTPEPATIVLLAGFVALLLGWRRFAAARRT